MYQILDKLVVRTPGFSMDSFNNLEFEKRLADPRFVEALYIASQDLVSVLLKNNPDKVEAALPAITKYLLRSSFRCTPYGLFAGVGVARWGETNNIQLQHAQRRTRLDMQYIHDVGRKLAAMAGEHANLKFTSNNSFYKQAGHIRYMEFMVKDGKRHYSLSEVEMSEELETLLDFASEGRTFSSLTSLLTTNGFDEDDSLEFVRSLIESQLLISEISPAITGDDCLDDLISKLLNADAPNVRESAEILSKVNVLMQQLDGSAINPVSSYEKILALLDQIGVPYQRNKVFQVDMFRQPGKNSVDHRIRKKIQKSIDILLKLTPGVSNRRLTDFKNRFRDRYESRTMPLVEVLDTESGIGYPQLIEGDITSLMQEVIRPKQQQNSTFTLSRVQQWLMRRLHQSLFENQYNIDITERELHDLQASPESLPASCSVMFRVTNAATHEILIESAGSANAVQLIGRFAYSNDEMHEIAKSIVDHEKQQHPDSIHAEIVHVPEDRLANIAIHPRFYDYEIPCLSVSSVNKDHQILLKDIDVCIVDNNIKLSLRSNGKEIIPRLSNAHNHHLSEVAIYRFLCDIQSQNARTNLSFNWGPMSDECIFLPRVTHDGIILHAATWNFKRSDLENLRLTSGDAMLTEVNSFRHKWKMPRFVLLTEFDNELMVDFENALTVKSWIHAIRTKERVTMKEFLFDSDTPVVDANGERYLHQFIATILAKVESNESREQPASPSHEVQRKFIPGTEWISLKIYASSRTTEGLLAGPLNHLVDYLKQTNQISQWFFVRYKDTHQHLRLRFLLNDKSESGNVMREVENYFRPFIDNDTIWKIQIDTYERELERYGYHLIERCERFFWADSIAIIGFVKYIQSSKTNDDLRWLWGLYAADRLLSDFGFTLEDKIRFMLPLKTAFASEFGMNKTAEISIDKKYRKYRSQIDSALAGRTPLDHFSISLLDERSKAIRESLHQLNSLRESTGGFAQLTRIIESLMHMSLNRLIQHSQRFHEMILYDFLYRYYVSVRAQGKTESAPGNTKSGNQADIMKQ